MEENFAWANQTEEEVPVITEPGFITTKNMTTMIFVEEVMATESIRGCKPTQSTRSLDGQVEWRL